MKTTWKARCCCLAVTMALAAGQGLPVYAAAQAPEMPGVIQPAAEENVPAAEEDGAATNTPPGILKT